MQDYRPSIEQLAVCGFRRSSAAGQWCHMKNIHLHYFEDEHALEVYNGPVHPRYNLTSQNDEAFQAEVQVLASAPPIQ